MGLHPGVGLWHDSPEHPPVYAGHRQTETSGGINNGALHHVNETKWSIVIRGGNLAVELVRVHSLER